MIRIVILNIALALFIFGCNVEDSVTDTEPNPSPLEKITEYQTGIPEPSGLTLDSNPNYLWTVSDNTNQVYKIDLEGNVIKTLEFIGDDLEGITYDTINRTLWLAEERLRQLVNIDTNGNELGRFDIRNVEGENNSGIEGVCFESDGTFAVLNEKEPSLWAKLDSSFTAVSVKNINNVEDLSGIASAGNSKYWIASDQSQKLFLWSLSASVIAEYSVNYEKAEGIAFNLNNNLLYVVSDKTAKLYVYKINF